MTQTRLRSQQWFNNIDDPEMTARWVERFLNYGLTLKGLRSCILITHLK